MNWCGPSLQKHTPIFAPASLGIFIAATSHASSSLWVLSLTSNAKGSIVLFMPEIPRSQAFVLKIAPDVIRCSRQISAQEHSAVADTA